MNRAGPIRVLIINDLPLLRQALAAALEQHADLHVLGCGGRVEEVRRALILTHPEVILFDLDLPRAEALELLKKLRAHYPVPIVVCAAGGPDRAMRALRAIRHGAVDVVERPESTRGPEFAAYVRELASKVRRLASEVRPIAPQPPARGDAAGFRATGLDSQRYLVVLGASTGGTQAISTLVAAAPADFPPLLIVQHMPAGFTASFAQRLNGLGALRVSEAAEGDRLGAGRAVVARGDRHLVVRAAIGDAGGAVRSGCNEVRHVQALAGGDCGSAASGPNESGRSAGGDGRGVGVGEGRWRVHYTHDCPVNRHCPSVDVLFESALPYARRTIGVLLTGMGADGAAGLAALRQAGALTIAQDEASCVVYGMPKEAVRRGAAQHVAPPAAIPGLIVRALRGAGASEKSRLPAR